MQALVKCAMKIKENVEVEEEKDCLAKKLLKGGLYKAVSENWLGRFQ